jgi:transposase-like protein
MSHNHSALTSLISDLLAEPDLAHEDVFRRMLQVGMQDLVNAEATAKIGAGRYERTPERATRRNGTRAKRLATRKVDQLVRALGNDTGISRSTVSRICSELDEAVREFLGRRLDHTWFPYLFLDATYLDVRARPHRRFGGNCCFWRESGQAPAALAVAAQSCAPGHAGSPHELRGHRRPAPG